VKVWPASRWASRTLVAVRVDFAMALSVRSREPHVHNL
jgi:hypothetical protein